MSTAAARAQAVVEQARAFLTQHAGSTFMGSAQRRTDDGSVVAYGVRDVDLAAFAQAEIEAEREACARVADAMYERGPVRPSAWAAGWAQAWGSGVLDVAEAIRTRATTGGERDE